jgi:hypothetical protein
LNSFDCERVPLSARIVTTICPGPSSLASRIAPQTLIPAYQTLLLLDQREQHRQHLGISDLVLAVGPKADDVA